jgi:uncharacterized protein (DUF2235 family)
MLESYIVRIYRGEKDSPHNLVGIVEEVGLEEKKAFTNLDELWTILNSIRKGRGTEKQRVRQSK